MVQAPGKTNKTRLARSWSFLVLSKATAFNSAIISDLFNVIDISLLPTVDQINSSRVRSINIFEKLFLPELGTLKRYKQKIDTKNRRCRSSCELKCLERYTKKSTMQEQL